MSVDIRMKSTAGKVAPHEKWKVYKNIYHICVALYAKYLKIHTMGFGKENLSYFKTTFCK